MSRAQVVPHPSASRLDDVDEIVDGIAPILKEFVAHANEPLMAKLTEIERRLDDMAARLGYQEKGAVELTNQLRTALTRDLMLPREALTQMSLSAVKKKGA